MRARAPLCALALLDRARPRPKTAAPPGSAGLPAKMMQQAAKQLAPLLADAAGSFAAGQGFAQYAAPAVAAKSGGLFGGKRVTVPLSEPLAGVDIPKYAAPAAPKLEVRFGAG